MFELLVGLTIYLHRTGAGHSFENGQGSTYGIMDYGPGTKDGIYQFNTQFRKAEVCGEINSNINCEYFGSYAPVCGNGIVEQGEACECPSGTNCNCCKQCQLPTGAQCGEGECCDTNTCKFKDVTTSCAAQSKVCSAGSCAPAQLLLDPHP